jgi:glycosyltransferase involved in cell wall biosynthesis
MAGDPRHGVRQSGQAVIAWASGDYDISGALVGRQSASEGFLRAYVRCGGADPLLCLSGSRSDIDAFRQYAARHAPGGVTCEGLLPTEMWRIATAGTLFVPGPDLGHYAWLRRGMGQRGFSICGVNHALSERMVMEEVGGLLISPMQEWDALVCTSTVSRQAIVRILDEYAAYMAQLTGVVLKARPRLPLIPLGVDCAAFVPAEGDAAARARQRARLGIQDDEIVLLYFGRFNHMTKANPAPMYIAAEQAAERTGRRIRLLQVGWFPSADVEGGFRQAAAQLSPLVTHQFVDGRQTENRATWFAADIFVSFSDNLQESFGLTPIEAMAAGLPVVTSDWSGYRDSVRDGIDGLRIPTLMQPPGMGEALAFIPTAGIAPHSTMVGAAAQITALDTVAAATALTTLIDDPDLRQRMGAAGRARARETFDWPVIVRAYQRLWAELAAIRAAAPEAVPLLPGRAARPLAMDPFALFREFPTRFLAAGTRIALSPGVDVAAALAMGRLAIAAPVRAILLDDDGLAHLVRRLGQGPASVRELADLFPAAIREPVWFTLGWLCKMGLARWE